MPAGTIALTINSKTVTGSGTAFTTELKVNDFVVAVVGGVTYTLGVAAIASNTSLTLNTAFGGPTTSGLSWTAVPNQVLVGITAQVASDTARAIRGLNYDKDNWQKIYSDVASVTVQRPDGSTFTGPSWGYMSSQYANKAAKGANSDITSLTGLTTALSVAQGGTGGKTAAEGRSALGVAYGTTAGTVVQGNDSRLSTVNGMTGGAITGDLSIEGNNINLRSTSSSGWTSFVNFMAGQGNNLTMSRIYNEDSGSFTIGVNINTSAAKFFNFRKTGDMVSPGNIQCVSLSQTSDVNKKTDILEITKALESIDGLKGYTYKLKDGGKVSAGIIAQEWQKVLPSIVSEVNQEDVVYDEEGLPTGEVIKSSSLSVDYSGVCAFLLSALRELKLRHDSMTTELDEVRARLKALDGLDS